MECDRYVRMCDRECCMLYLKLNQNPEHHKVVAFDFNQATNADDDFACYTFIRTIAILYEIISDHINYILFMYLIDRFIPKKTLNTHFIHTPYNVIITGMGLRLIMPMR